MAPGSGSAQGQKTTVAPPEVLEVRPSRYHNWKFQVLPAVKTTSCGRELKSGEKDRAPVPVVSTALENLY